MFLVGGLIKIECKCYGYNFKLDFVEGGYLLGWCKK